MRVIVQRVKDAVCKVDGNITGKCDNGFMILVGFTLTDTDSELNLLAKKVAGLRVFNDSFDKMNLSLKDIGGSILSISQFTLYADARHGNRPSFTSAMPGEKAKILYDKFNDILRNEYGLHVECGIFGADMKVSFLNDGPVTIILDSKEL